MSDRRDGDQHAHFFWSGRRNRRFTVFSWGFQWAGVPDDLSGRWEEISTLTQSVTRHLYNGSHTYTEYHYTLLLVNGCSVRLNGTLRAGDARNSANVGIWLQPGAVRPITIEQLGRILSARVTSVLLPAAIARFRAGESTSFGRLTVGPHGIATGYDSVAWSEIQDVQTRSGFVSVKKAGKWLAWKSVAVSRMPNYDVFDALVHTILTELPAA
jgi:hypothetical protein